MTQSKLSIPIQTSPTNPSDSTHGANIPAMQPAPKPKPSPHTTPNSGNQPNK